MMPPTNRPRPPYPTRERIGDWFNLRRRLNAEHLLHYIRFHGLKIFVTTNTYAAIREECGLDAYQVDGAIDDLHRLGCVNIRMAGGTQIIELLDSNIDRFSRIGGGQ